MDVSDQHHAPADLPSRENPGTHEEGAGWAPEPVTTFYYYYYYFKFKLAY
jgi:hypothetical protein